MILWEAERMKLDDRWCSVWIETGKGQALVNAVHVIAYLRNDPREAARVWEDIKREASEIMKELRLGLPQIIQYNAPHAYGLLPVIIGLAVLGNNPNRKGKLRGEMRLVIAHECEFDDVTVALTETRAA